MTPNIVAIDPGTTESAVVEWSDAAGIYRAEIVPNEKAVSMLYRSAPERRVYCEMIASYGMPVGKEVFETCLWIGHFRHHCWSEGIPFELVYRRDVKLHHCGTARAKDSNVMQALKDKYGSKGTKKAPGMTYSLRLHLWQAFAIAAMVIEQNGYYKVPVIKP